MINSTGIVKLQADALVVYNSPIITIVGQSSSRNQEGLVHITLEIKSQDLSSVTQASISISTESVKDLMLANSVDGASFVTNLYSLLEQLLKGYLETINPDTTFEL